MFFRPGSEKSCLCGLAPRKVGLRKVVYSDWVGEALFIWPSMEKNWSEKSCLFGLGRRKTVYLPSSEKSWSEKSCLSGRGWRKVGLRKVVYPTMVGEKLV